VFVIFKTGSFVGSHSLFFVEISRMSDGELT